MKKLNTLLTASASYLILGSALAADPSAVNVTLFKTEVCNDTACTTILDDTAGVSAELVSGDGAFGNDPDVNVGSYNRFRFTLKNEILVSGTPDAPCSTVNNQQSLIDSSLASTDQVTISFATGDAATPGSTGWYANGTAAHPFFMNAPVVVEANGTTDVTVQFNTAGTLNCVAGAASIDAPTFAVSSYVQPPAATTFTGGDYWLVGTSMHSPWFEAKSNYTVGQFLSGAWPTTAISTGQMIPPQIVNGTSVYEVLLNDATDGPKYQAQIRSKTTREMRWGMKLNMSTPDSAGAGTISFLREPGYQRFSAVFGGSDESFMAAPGVDATPTVVGSYHVDANNRLTILPTGGTPIQGAISDDYQTLVVGDTSDGINLTMGVKVAAGLSTMPANTYSWNQYMIEVGRDDSVGSGADGLGENGDEKLNSYYHGSIGWLDATNIINASIATIGAKLEVQDPDLTTSTSTAYQSDETMSGDFSAFLSGFADGAGMVGPQLDNWMAVSPSGQVAIMTGAGEYDYRFSDLSVGDPGRTEFSVDRYQKNFSFNIMVQLAGTGVHTMTSLAGTYYIGGLWDNLSSGNSSFGGSSGEVTFNADGTGSVVISNIDNLNRINTDVSTIGWDILSACIGVTEVLPATTPATYNRLEVIDPNCVANGGKVVDAMVVYDPATPTQHHVAIFPSADGKAITFFDPDSLDVNGQDGRSLGLGVKLK